MCVELNIHNNNIHTSKKVSLKNDFFFKLKKKKTLWADIPNVQIGIVCIQQQDQRNGKIKLS